MSVHANLCSSKGATTSYLSGILSRLLCSRGLPTHPSDHTTDTTSMRLPCDIMQQDPVQSFQTPPADPGILAKLMGLETFPSMLRSRSMNSIELSKQKAGQHTRAKSRLSFHELTPFLELENEQFFVLTFAKRGDKKEDRPVQRQSGVGFGEFRRKRREKRTIKENRNDRKTKEDKHAINKMVLCVMDKQQLAERSSDMPYQETAQFSKTYAANLRDLDREINTASARQEWNESDGPNFTRKKKKSHRCEQVELSWEESSPVSTLDFDKFMIDPEAGTSEEHGNWRRKLSSRPENCEGLSWCMDENGNRGDYANSKTRGETWERGGSSKDERSRVRAVEEGEWLWGQKLEDFEEFNAEFGLEILDGLIGELIQQLV